MDNEDVVLSGVITMILQKPSGEVQVTQTKTKKIKNNKGEMK